MCVLARVLDKSLVSTEFCLVASRVLFGGLTSLVWWPHEFGLVASRVWFGELNEEHGWLTTNQSICV